MFDSFISLIVVALAVWRLSSMFVNEEGPYDAFGIMRSAAGIKFDAYSVEYSDTMLGKLLLCVWCTSVWVGFALTVSFFFFPAFTFWLSLPFAFSACSVVMDKAING